jgi:hypothetical protein
MSANIMIDIPTTTIIGSLQPQIIPTENSGKDLILYLNTEWIN